MTFALLFLIVLSLILLVGAYLIWKSDLSDNDKIISIIAILALFALVSIVNEAKKSSQGDVKYNLFELEKSFLTPRAPEIEYKYRLPLLNDFEEWIKSSLLDYNLENSETFLFGLLIGGSKNGKTLAFQEYTRLLQQKKIPTIYIDIKDSNANVFNLLGYLKLANINLLEEVIDKFNENKKIPCIFVDNIHNGFAHMVKDYESTMCPICQYLKILYDSKQVNIVMITDRYDVGPKMLSSTSTISKLIFNI